MLLMQTLHYKLVMHANNADIIFLFPKEQSWSAYKKQCFLTINSVSFISTYISEYFYTFSGFLPA